LLFAAQRFDDGRHLRMGESELGHHRLRVVLARALDLRVDPVVCQKSVDPKRE
jgi:hypothetical protein